MNIIKWFSEITSDEINAVGGKGLSLGRLTQANISVPAGFVITTEAYKTGMDSEIADVIVEAFNQLGSERVAVRSSAIAEDSADASWAGQFESYLNVTKDQLIDRVKKCWGSVSSEIVSDYAEGQTVSGDKLALAVVVQKMVDSEVSGVAFSANPLTKDVSQVMIEATFGLGELLVQGMVTPDNYLVDKTTSEILEKHISHKTDMLVFANGKNEEKSVSDDIADEPCLEDSQIQELASLVINIEKYCGSPQDVEWAVENAKFFVVQSRPITTL